MKMNITSSYGVRIKPENIKFIQATTDIVTKAVKYFVTVFEKEWDFM